MLAIATPLSSASAHFSAPAASAPSPPALPLPPPAFVFLSATYGAEGLIPLNVTSKVAPLFDSEGRVLRQIGNDFNKFFGRDPCPGVLKTLQIVYLKNGIQHTASVLENAEIHLDSVL